MFDCWFLIFCFGCFSPLKCKNSLKNSPFSPFFCAVTNRRERKHMRLIVVLEHPVLARKVSFWLLFCLVLGTSPYNTIIYLNSNDFLLLFSLTCSSECYYSIPKRRQVGNFFSSRTMFHSVKSHHGCWMGWLLWKSKFHHSTWY